MFIVDSQVHIWGAETAERPWRSGPRNPPQRSQPYTKDDALREMDDAGVARAVLVSPSMEGERNDLVLEAAQLHPERFAAMGRIAVEQRTDSSVVTELMQHPGMKGLRVTFFPERPGYLADAIGKLDWWLWAEAERVEAPLMIAANAALLTELDKIAHKHSALKIAIDHAGAVFRKKDEAAFANLLLVLALAKWPNVCVKVSAIPCFSSEDYPYRGLHPYLKRIYDAFGPRRMFWGTDLARLPCSYRQAITLFTEELPWLTADDREWIMGKALCTWLNWPIPAGARYGQVDTQIIRQNEKTRRSRLPEGNR